MLGLAAATVLFRGTTHTAMGALSNLAHYEGIGPLLLVLAYVACALSTATNWLALLSRPCGVECLMFFAVF